MGEKSKGIKTCTKLRTSLLLYPKNKSGIHPASMTLREAIRLWELCFLSSSHRINIEPVLFRVIQPADPFFLSVFWIPRARSSARRISGKKVFVGRHAGSGPDTLLLLLLLRKGKGQTYRLVFKEWVQCYNVGVNGSGYIARRIED